MTVDSDNDLENQIAEWRTYVHRRRELHHTDAEELEDHLRSRISELTEAGLLADEAFLVAVKRMGSLDDVSREFAGSTLTGLEAARPGYRASQRGPRMRVDGSWASSRSGWPSRRRSHQGPRPPRLRLR